MDPLFKAGDRVRITIETTVEDVRAFRDYERGELRVFFAGRYPLVLPSFANRETHNTVVTVDVLERPDVLPAAPAEAGGG
jgi:hypothetical protein